MQTTSLSPKIAEFRFISFTGALWFDVEEINNFQCTGVGVGTGCTTVYSGKYFKNILQAGPRSINRTPTENIYLLLQLQFVITFFWKLE